MEFEAEILCLCCLQIRNIFKNLYFSIFHQKWGAEREKNMLLKTFLIFVTLPYDKSDENKVKICSWYKARSNPGIQFILWFSDLLPLASLSKVKTMRTDRISRQKKVKSKSYFLLSSKESKEIKKEARYLIFIYIVNLLTGTRWAKFWITKLSRHGLFSPSFSFQPLKPK